jgi:hypothetical protein
LKDGFLPIAQYVYDEQMYRLAELMREVGVDATLAVNTDCLYLKKGTQHRYHDKYDTNCYDNLGKVQMEPEPKCIRAKMFESLSVDPLDLEVLNPPTVVRRRSFSVIPFMVEAVKELLRR